MESAAKTSTIEIDGLQIELVQKKMKNMSIRVCPPEGRILVTAPLHFSAQKIISFLRERAPWMNKHQKKFKAKYDAHVLQKASLPEPLSPEEFEKELSFLVAKWSLILNVKVASFRVRLMKSRWGSCHILEHRIVFNSELAKQSHACIEYVVAHELIHLIEPSHNARFKRFMTEAIPNWRQLKEELVI